MSRPHPRILSRRTLLHTGSAAVALAVSGIPPLNARPQPKPATRHLGFVSAAATRDGSFYLAGFDASGQSLFSNPVTERYHGFAVHPTAPIMVAVARRPGTHIQVLSHPDGQVQQIIAAPADRHVYGHGCFSADGRRFWCTENAFDTEHSGRLGVYDTGGGAEGGSWRRLGELSTHGIGPHEVIRCPATGLLVVANGGIETHPDFGRSKLNIHTMAPSLVHLDPEDGRMVHVATLPPQYHQASIRHIAAAPDGTIIAALQWEGDRSAKPPLIATVKPGEAFHVTPVPDPLHDQMALYCGSVAVDPLGQSAAVTAPRGNLTLVLDIRRHVVTGSARIADGCGVAAESNPDGQSGFIVSSGSRGVFHLPHTPTLSTDDVRNQDHSALLRAMSLSPPTASLHWDNHLSPIVSA